MNARTARHRSAFAVSVALAMSAAAFARSVGGELGTAGA